jgi:tRNA-binding protein
LNVLEKTKKPAYQSKVDFGNEIGCKKSSAQITNFMSEIPVLGIYSNTGVVLIIPDKDAQSGDKLD